MDDIEGNWRLGPELPFAIDDGSLMEDPAGGVIFVGGDNKEALQQDTIYRLSHAGPDASWFKMPQRLQNARNYHVSFLVPDGLTNCTLA